MAGTIYEKVNVHIETIKNRQGDNIKTLAKQNQIVK